MGTRLSLRNKITFSFQFFNVYIAMLGEKMEYYVEGFLKHLILDCSLGLVY